MDAKWPFIIILFFFLGLTGYLISHLERSKVMADWENRRCHLPVMVAARFFKPDTDPRSPHDFSNDNFEFCIKQFTDSFMNLFMPPIAALLGKQATLTGGAMGALNQVREIVRRITSAFTSYLSSFTDKFKNSMFEFRRIIAYLRMAIGRLMAVVTSTIYIGLSLFSGMLSSIQVVIRVVLIICAIMIVLIIILWFILLPVIPFILSTLTAIVSLVVALSVVMSGSIASEAESQKSGFCFSEHTSLLISRDGEQCVIPISQVRIGDVILSKDAKEHRITAVMEMTSKDVNWYNIDGIYVAGDHMVQEDGEWIYVKGHSRAIDVSHLSLSNLSPRVYCLNTTSRMIPIIGLSGCHYFRDWEELEEEDEEGHRLWRKTVYAMLNGRHSDTLHDSEDTEWKEDQSIPLVGQDTLVWTILGWRKITDLKVGDVICDSDGGSQNILGIVKGETVIGNEKGKATGQLWDGSQGGWIKKMTAEGVAWKRRKDRQEGMEGVGWNLITERGEWVVLGRNGERETVSDFTEVGHIRIRELYSLVSDRLSGSCLTHL
jgi:hypothetical protein